MLEIRNTSILIHHMQAISDKSFRKIKSCIYEYLVEFMNGEDKLTDLLNSAKMTTFNYE